MEAFEKHCTNHWKNAKLFEGVASFPDYLTNTIHLRKHFSWIFAIIEWPQCTSKNAKAFLRLAETSGHPQQAALTAVRSYQSYIRRRENWYDCFRDTACKDGKLLREVKTFLVKRDNDREDWIGSYQLEKAASQKRKYTSPAIRDNFFLNVSPPPPLQLVAIALLP